MPLAGKPEFQVANASGAPIGYGETKAPGSAADHEKVLAGEQIDRYRRNLSNLLVTDIPALQPLPRRQQPVRRAEEWRPDPSWPVPELPDGLSWDYE